MSEFKLQLSFVWVLVCIAILSGNPNFSFDLSNNSIENNASIDITPKPQQMSEPEEFKFDIIDIRAKVVSFDERLLLSSMEGIVNRNQSKLFLYYSEASTVWLEYLNTTRYRGYNFTFNVLTEVIDRYGSFFAGVVSFDSQSYDEINLATPLAGIYNALLVPNSLYSTFRTWYPAQYPLIRNISQDLLGKITRVDRYEWAFEHYYPLCNQSAVCLYAGDIAQYMRSFIVKNNLFTLWRVLYVHTDIPLEWGQPALDPDPDEELAFFEQFLADIPVNIPVYGYMWADGANEGEVMRRISAANKYLIAADFFENLPFFSSMQLPDGYKFEQYRPSTYRTLENKIYISGIWSDGDNIQYVYNYMRPYLWTASTPNAGNVPTGWTLNPSLYHLAPYVARFYYENATRNDYFIGGLSGKGYTKMDYYTDQAVMVQFLKESQVLWDLMDMRESRIWQLEKTAQKVVETVDLEGIFDGYLGSLKYMKPRIVDGIPIIKSVGVTGSPDAALEFIQRIRQLNPIRPQFYFFHLHCWLFTAEMWQTLATELTKIDGVVLVRPDELSNLMQQWNGWGNELYFWGLGAGLILGCIFIIIKMVKKKKQKKATPPNSSTEPLNEEKII
jgi:hypothetical protein